LYVHIRYWLLCATFGEIPRVPCALYDASWTPEDIPYTPFLLDEYARR